MRDWDNFYVIVGSAAAALTGLQFVAMTLITQSNRPRFQSDIDAFGTPLVVHFAMTLLISALASAPWPETASLGVALAACAIGGIVYVAIVARRARRARYQPVLEDWIWHVVLPLAAYGVLLAGALVWLARGPHTAATFLVAVSSLMLLFIGIHNAWDTVTYVVINDPQPPSTRD
jgi:divalent metal cation (Fe/Co/Zn/Cd) transporter